MPPSVVVKAQFPGANPNVIAETVATPLEEQINGTENMLYMFSQAASDGTLTLTVTFKIGTDPDLAQQLVQNRVNQALPRLPQVTQALGVTTTKSSPDLTMVVHLNSPDGRYDMLYLRNYAVLNVKDRLAKIEGIGAVQLFGSGDYAMRIWLNPDRIAERGMTAADVVAAIRKQNVQVAAGVINGPPYSQAGRLQLPINVQGRLSEPEQFENIVVKRDNGVVTRLGDVARVEIDASQYGLRSLLDNKQAVAIPVFQAPGSNAIAISDQVRATMEELKQNFPKGMDYSIVYDPTVFVARLDPRRRPHAARGGGAGGSGGDPVPADLARLDHSASRRAGLDRRHLRLHARLRLLDQRAVAVRAGARHRHRRRRRHRRGRERGAQHRGGPGAARGDAQGHVGGDRTDHRHRAGALRRVRADRLHQRLTGEFYRQFALTIAFSTVISAFNSLTLSPALAATLLKAHGAPKDALARGMDRVFGPFFGAFNRVFHRGSQNYGRGVRGVLRQRARAFAVYGALLGLTWLGFQAVPPGFVPMQDKAYLVSFAQLPEGATLDRTEAVIRKMSAIALGEPGVESAVAFPGLSINGFINSASAGVVFVTLKPFDERDRSGLEIAQTLQQKFGSIGSNTTIAIFPPPPVMGLGTIGGFKLQVEDRTDRGDAALDRAMQDIQAKARRMPELTGVFSSSTSACRSSTPISTAPRRCSSASTSRTFSTRCRPIWARSMSTTSTASAAPIR